MIARNISEYLENAYGTNISPESRANITGALNDAVKDGATIRAIEACHNAVGVDKENRTRVLDM